jgi:outer membrane protein assembly factor BamB
VLTIGAGSGLQGGTSVQVKSYSNAGYTLGFDLVIVGTRNVGSATNNKIVGLNGNTGAIVWTANTPNLDFISSTPQIDYANNVVWVTSRSNGGSQPSLWKINSNTGTVLASFNLGNVDQSPTLSYNGNVLYVLQNNSATGSVIDAIRTDLANCSVAFSLGNVNPVGFAIPINTSATDDDIYFSTTTNMRKVHFTHGAGCGGAFTDSPGGWTNPAMAAPSAPVFTQVPRPLFLYVGSSDGHLYKINPTTGAIVANRLINAGAIIGDPTFDAVSLKFYIGDSSGRVYSFDLF